jgi:F0F1-type ATP synthase assembly protein I
MSKNPFNLALRFLLEIAALVSLGIFGNFYFEGGLGVIAAMLLPLFFAITWGVFAVRGDPSRSGKTVVATPGIIRLLLELLLFGCAIAALNGSGYTSLSLIFLILLILHYLLSLDRVRWLIGKK